MAVFSFCFYLVFNMVDKIKYKQIISGIRFMLRYIANKKQYKIHKFSTMISHHNLAPYEDLGLIY